MHRLWVHQLGTGSLNAASGLAVDAAGNATVTGDTYGTPPSVAANASDDAFVATYDAADKRLCSTALCRGATGSRGEPNTSGR